MKRNGAKKKNRIAVLGHKTIPSRRGGIERVVTVLCPMFVEKGYQVTCYNRREKTESEELVIDGKYKGVRLKTVPTIQKKGLSAVTSSIWGSLYAAIGPYDIVHYHAEGPCAMMWLPKLFGKKCIATVHGLDWKRDKWKKSLGTKYIKLGEKVMVRFSDEIIVLSKNIKHYFNDTYGRKCVYIPNGVKMPEKRKPQIITEKYGLTKDSYYLVLARLAEEKGVHYLIEAYQNIVTDKKLVISGYSSDSDEYVRKLKQMAAGNPNIVFTGFVAGEILEEIYSNAYVYVLPSNLEGMPLSLLEAMSYGNCVIGSDIPEITEVVEDKGVIFRKGNVKDLEEKMRMLEEHPEIVSRYKEQSAKFITQKYSWEKTARQTMELYRSTLSD